MIYFSTVEYTTPIRGLPHSRQHAFSRDVINPQEGHILCVPYGAIRGFRLRLLRSSRKANSAISKPTNMLVAFIKDNPSWRIPRLSAGMPKVRAAVVLAQDRHGKQTAVAEKPKMGELQMDWLRSEDLKEVKVATAPFVSLAVMESVA